MLRAPRRTNLTATLFPHTTVFRSIIMLEPRRQAARAAAERLASELSERVGETVGYRIRLDSKVGPNTRIEVVTEGILARRLQDDPALEGVGLVIFDDFHVLLNAQEVALSCQKSQPRLASGNRNSVV